MEIKDLAGLSKPLTKLIEVISQGVGAISKPYLIKKTADAKAYELKKITEAIAEKNTVLKSIDYTDSKLTVKSIDSNEIESIEQRVDRRLSYQESKRQTNIEDIAQKSAKYIENEKEVAEEKVDEDWTSRYFNYAQDVSNDEMQELWARILAGEVVKPGSFSLRTLELIRNLSKNEAEIFNRFANLTIYSFDSPCIYQGKSQDNSFLQKFNCSFNDRLLLVEVGLLQPDTSISRSIPSNETDNESIMYHKSGNLILKQTLQPKSPKVTFSIYRFSKIGEELLKIISIQPNLEYLKEFARDNTNNNSGFEIAHILKEQENGQVLHTNWEKITTANNV